MSLGLCDCVEMETAEELRLDIPEIGLDIGLYWIEIVLGI